MKKKTIFFATMLLIMALALSACSLVKPRTALTADDFKTKMESAGLTVEDATDQFEEGTVELVLIAYNDDYQIEFYVMETAAKAEQSFAGNKQNFEALSGNKSTASLNGSNFNSFTMTLGGQYAVVSRVENTFIYVDEEVEHRDTIKEILKDLGY